MSHKLLIFIDARTLANTPASTKFTLNYFIEMFQFFLLNIPIWWMAVISENKFYFIKRIFWWTIPCNVEFKSIKLKERRKKCLENYSIWIWFPTTMKYTAELRNRRQMHAADFVREVHRQRVNGLQNESNYHVSSTWMPLRCNNVQCNFYCCQTWTIVPK